jgi:hypothetical protein
MTFHLKILAGVKYKDFKEIIEVVENLGYEATFLDGQSLIIERKGVKK